MDFKKILLTSTVLAAGISQATTFPISGGFANGITILKDNNVYAWGLNSYTSKEDTLRNILCLDSSAVEFGKPNCSTPNLVDTKGIKFTKAEAGSCYILSGISDKGVLYYWGMTDLTTVLQPTPVKSGDIPGFNEDGTPGGEYLGNVKKVAITNTGFIALLNDGSAVLSENFDSLLVAKDENGEILKNIVDVRGGDQSYFALTSDGLLYSTGAYNGHDNVSSRPLIFSDILKPVSTNTLEPLENVVSYGAGDCCAFAATKDGHAYGWGNGGWGGCAGTGELSPTYHATPIVAGDYSKISGKDYLDNVKQIDGGRGYGMAVTFDGHLLFWGNNDDNGGVAPSNVKGRFFIRPIFATYEDGRIVDDAVAIECGDNFGFVVNRKNQYFAFGLNDLGQCGVGEDTTTAIHYLHPMNFSSELRTLCPSVRLLSDTTIACTNGSSAIEAFTSSVSDDKDYRLDWYFNGKKLSEKSNICVVDEEGEYKVVMTPTDSLCESSSDYTYAKANKVVVESLGNQISVEDTAIIKEQNVTFKFTSAEATTIVLYSDEECTNAIDTLAVEEVENIIAIPGSSLSLKGDTVNVWVMENKQTTLFPEANGSYLSFQKYGMLLKTKNNATLHSFKFKAKSFVGSAEVTATPMLYRAYLDNKGFYTEFDTVSTGQEQKFVVNEEGTECTLVCDFKIPNNGIYVIGMDFNGTVSMFLISSPEMDINSTLLKEPVVDENNYGIEWVGCSSNSYATANGSEKTCYYDLKFSDIEFVSCGAMKLTTKIDTVKTDCINITNAEKANGENYDIFGRKVKNAQSNRIYIQNGKKYIFKK